MIKNYTLTEPLVIASHNIGKVKEIADLLEPLNIKVKAASDFGLDAPEETGESFCANAALKACFVAKETGLTALADDSGLCVNALDNAPGIYSARWAGADQDFNKAMQKIADRLEGEQDRSCHFICALALGWPTGHFVTFEGRIDGKFTWPPRGTKGFGYDPAFTPDGFTCTFSEMEPRQKHAMSHRARAFSQLLKSEYFCIDDK